MFKQSLFLIITFLLSFLVSCNNGVGDIELSNVDSKNEMISIDNSKENVQNKTDESSVVAAGTYGDKTITMEYYAVTPYRVDPNVLSVVSGGYACVVISNDNNYGFAFVSPEGDILNDTYYPFSYGFDSDGRALVQFEDKSWHHIDTSGNDLGLAELSYNNGNNSADGDWFYEENGYYGVTDENGARITEPIFESYNIIKNGYAEVYYFKNGSLAEGYVDRRGKIIELPESARLCMMVDDRIYLKSQRDSMWTVLDLDGSVVLDKKYHELEICDKKYYAVIEDGKLGLIDFDGNEIISPTLLCDWTEDMNIGYGEGYLTVVKDGCLAFVKITESEQAES